MSATEATIAKNIVRYLRGLPYAHARRTWQGGSMAQAGEPDVDAVVDGRSVRLEVKRPETRRRVTPLQAVALHRWSAAGAVVGVVCSVEEVQVLLAAHGLDALPAGVTVDEQRRVLELCRPPAPPGRDEAADPEGSTASR